MTVVQGGKQMNDEHMEKMLTDLIRIVGATNSKLDRLAESSAESFARIEERLSSIEQGMYRLERLEKRQNKTAVRLEEIEADIALIQEQLNS